MAWAFSLAGASFFPALVMGIWWKRANKIGAIVGMLVGLGVTPYYMIGSRFFGVSWFGTQTIASAIFGLPAGFLTIWIVSLLTAPPPQDVQDLVVSVRYPKSGQGTKGDPLGRDLREVPVTELVDRGERRGHWRSRPRVSSAMGERAAAAAVPALRRPVPLLFFMAMDLSGACTSCSRDSSRDPQSPVLWFFAVVTGPLTRPVRAVLAAGHSRAAGAADRLWLVYVGLWLVARVVLAQLGRRGASG